MLTCNLDVYFSRHALVVIDFYLGNLRRVCINPLQDLGRMKSKTRYDFEVSQDFCDIQPMAFRGLMWRDWDT